MTLSVSSCLTSRPRLAPSAERTAISGARTTARDILLLPAEDTTDDAVILGYRQTVQGARKLGPAAREWLQSAKRALRSFTYGTGRP